MRLKFVRCLSPGNDCDAPPIKAHSVQNAHYLDLLNHDGHVVTLARRVKEGVPVVEYVNRGRNEATTFTGLCARHDAEIFHVIEHGTLDFDNPEHLFLLAYRAVLKEVHATGEAAIQVQTAYTDRVAGGLDPKNEPSPMGILATQRLIVAYETYMYKTKLDAFLMEGRYQEMDHDVLHLKHRQPSIAASCLFSLDHVTVRDDVARVCLTIFPSEEGSTAVLTYLKCDSGPARLDLARVLDATGEHQQYELSRILLNYCENFVISPIVFEGWSPQKQAVIKEFFTRTILKDDLGYEDQALVLFD